MAREYSITPFAMTSADDDDSETQSETGSVDSLYCPPEVVTLDVRPTREQPFCPESDKVNRDLDKIRDIDEIPYLEKDPNSLSSMNDISPIKHKPRNPGTGIVMQNLHQIFSNKCDRFVFKKFTDNIVDIYPWLLRDVKQMLNPDALKECKDESQEIMDLIRGAVHIFGTVTEIESATLNMPFRTKRDMLCSIEKDVTQWAKYYTGGYEGELNNLFQTLQEIKFSTRENNLRRYLYYAGCSRPGGNVKSIQYSEKLITATRFLLEMVTPALEAHRKAYMKFTGM